ncbi:hypothetical protein, partial [Paenibacillus ferrarius]|uniref:hypothetical protein n=1 Tax=Paenibacillus ferrarius TaxID=1469647 RepID=UPI003D2C035B
TNFLTLPEKGSYPYFLMQFLQVFSLFCSFWANLLYFLQDRSGRRVGIAIARVCSAAPPIPIRALSDITAHRFRQSLRGPWRFVGKLAGLYFGKSPKDVCSARLCVKIQTIASKIDEINTGCDKYEFEAF